MTPAARIAAAADLLDLIFAGEPAEKALTVWARRSRFAGSKDRAAIRDHVFDALRCRRSYAALGGAETGRGVMLGQLVEVGTDPATLFTGEGHAPAALTDKEVAHLASAPAHGDLPAPVAHDMPDWLWPALEDTLGPETPHICKVLRHRAPVFLRINLRKTDRDTARADLARDGVQTVPHTEVPTALRITEGPRKLAQSNAYLDGRVELQDAASQALTAELPLQDGMRILDYCAGGGGKTLAMAGQVQAQFIAHDANPARLNDLTPRARRAGVDVEVTANPKGSHDLVLCDVPCSGSGSWRRAPEGKWLLTPKGLSALNSTQDDILTRCAPLVAPQGTLAYATCSLLRSENQDRVAHFCKSHPEWKLVTENQWLPGEDGDGFYLAQLRSPAR